MTSIDRIQLMPVGRHLVGSKIRMMLPFGSRLVMRRLAQGIRRLRMKTIKPFGRGLPRHTLRISLCDRNPDVARALAAAFLVVEDVEIEVERVERRFGWLFPEDLLVLLQYALPTSKGFPDRRSGREEILREGLAWPEEGLLFSIEHGDLWLDSWGERPIELAESLETARHAVRRAPTLIPIYSHRYLPAEPMLPGNPVFSVYGADTIIYGNDLASYLHHEFEMPLPEWTAQSPRSIPLWSELVTWNSNWSADEQNY